jgi:putative SOS response-associated peptidase YedK
MCGRFARFSPAHVFRMLYRLRTIQELEPQFNIAPGQEVYAVRGITVRDEGQRSAANQGFQKELVQLRWGLVPFWSNDPSFGSKLINARSETAAEKSSFRKPFKQQRCLIPADGFYEWKKTKSGSKQPYFVHMKDEQPFSLAGLWDRWQGPQGEVIASFTILTTEPNCVVKPIHKRMPVIIAQEQYDTWLDPTINEVVKLQKLLTPYDGEKMAAYPVSTYVNSPKHADKKCVAPLKNKGEQQTLF